MWLLYIVLIVISLLLLSMVVGNCWMIHILKILNKKNLNLINTIRDDIKVSQQFVLTGINNLEQEIRNTTKEVENTNNFLTTKGFTITFVAGLKDKMEKVIKEQELIFSSPKGNKATPASFTGTA